MPAPGRSTRPPGGQDASVRIRRHSRRPTDDRLGGRPPSIGGAVGRFLLGMLAASLVVGVGGFFALRAVAIDESERATRERVEDLGKVVEADLRDGILRRDPDAIALLDETVLARVVSGSIVRVKLWAG